MRPFYITLTLLASLCLINCQQSANSYAEALNGELEGEKNMFIIEREIPEAGKLTAEDLKGISQSSCDVIESIGEENITWLHSFVTSDKVYCVYMAKDESLIRKHAKQGGFPANSVESVVTVIDPLTASE